ncbi:MAG: response regulator [bacterium]|nr:response regulator [bacterium]
MYKVMIIDDEPIIVEGLSKSIPWERWNCEVTGSALNGIEGLQLIEKQRPDIVITDISMPQMDGLAMIAALKSQYDNIEITILTGYRDFEYAQQAVRLGVTRLLLKPSKMDELEEAIQCMTERLRRHHAGQNITKPIGAGLSGQSQQTGSQGEKAETEAGSFIVKNAMAYIRGHYKEKLTLSEVADKTYVSQWHLSKLLNGHTGQSFSEILNTVRIEEAKKLLENPALRIGDIADEVGFLDMAHFSRVFKKICGISANEYRNQL